MKKLIIYLYLFFLTSSLALGSQETLLKDYSVYANFAGRGLFELNLKDKTRHVFFTNKHKQVLFRFVGEFRFFKSGVVAEGYVQTVDDPFYNLIGKFDSNGMLMKELDLFIGLRGWWLNEFSYSGQKVLIESYDKKKRGLLYFNLEEPKNLHYLADLKTKDIIFLRNDKAIIYQTDDFKIKKHDLKTKETEILIQADEPIAFGDVSYDNSQILCTDQRRILLLDLNTKSIKTIKEYNPGLFTFRRHHPTIPEYTRPIIVTGQFSWREDGKGFIFCRYGPWANFLWLSLDESYSEPDIYYYDMTTGKETLLWGGVGKRGIALVKKTNGG